MGEIHCRGFDRGGAQGARARVHESAAAEEGPATKKERESYRKIADDVFLEGMHASEPPVPAWKKYAAYYAVRMFGRWAINNSVKREV